MHVLRCRGNSRRVQLAVAALLGKLLLHKLVKEIQLKERKKWSVKMLESLC